jgi:Ca2+-binding RTX toxin-like protein
MEGGAGNDRIFGGTGADTIVGGTENDFIRGGAGDDEILGEAGQDDIDGETGNDMIDAGPGNDIVRGGAHNDMLTGGPNNDWIFGGDGIDMIDGGDGDDTVLGGLGADGLMGGPGADHLEGGAGEDGLVNDGVDTLIQGDDPTPSDETIGSLSQEISFGRIIGKIIGGVGDAAEFIGGAFIDFLEWTGERVIQFGLRLEHWAANLDNRIVSFAEGVRDGFNWPWKREFWGGWGRAIISGLDILGLSEAWETVFDIIHPWQRAMTIAEITEARKVFGDSIDYGRVRIDTLSIMAGIGGTHVTGYIINTAGGLTNEILIHELTHIWQYEEGGLVYIPEAIGAQRSGGYDYFGVAGLRAAMSQGLDFTAFNREQQGDIARDYYLLRELVVANPLDPNIVQWLADLDVYAYFVDYASTFTRDQLALRAPTNA